MRGYKDRGIVFKQIDVHEADKIVSIFTKYHGRIDAIAKGIRRTTSRKAGNMDLFSLSKFSFVKGKNLDIITEAELLDSQESLRGQLDSQFVVFYICELLDRFLQLEERDTQLFNLLIELLDELQVSKNYLPLHAFELKLMSTQGFEPNLYTCLLCGKSFRERDERYVTRQEVGLYCSNETVQKDQSVSDRSLRILRYLITADISDAKKVNSDRSTLQEIQRILFTWLEVITEKEIRSKKFLLAK